MYSAYQRRVHGEESQASRAIELEEALHEKEEQLLENRASAKAEHASTSAQLKATGEERSALAARVNELEASDARLRDSLLDGFGAILRGDHDGADDGNVEREIHSPNASYGTGAATATAVTQALHAQLGDRAAETQRLRSEVAASEASRAECAGHLEAAQQEYRAFAEEVSGWEASDAQLHASLHDEFGAILQAQSYAGCEVTLDAFVDGPDVPTGIAAAVMVTRVLQQKLDASQDELRQEAEVGMKQREELHGACEARTAAMAAAAASRAALAEHQVLADQASQELNRAMTPIIAAAADFTRRLQSLSTTTLEPGAPPG
eukprot:NODE_1619_length_1100_cov_325.102392.p1 GENE.NODE_1619_length_1100_cov_325.102392~~NODE_1619_length_1100_cov_325.102392.p1  ORF type:complete len:321 (+),score=53.82 NODE_1619_length_1100_cov_325.102392:41-1003(+)